jgi:hypothetical protein
MVCVTAKLTLQGLQEKFPFSQEDCSPARLFKKKK